MSNEKKINPCKVITSGDVRWSYVNVWEPKSPDGVSAPKYSVQLIISKDDKVTLTAIGKAINAAYEEGKSLLSDKNGRLPALKSLKQPMRDGDEEYPDKEEYKNAYFLNCSSVNKPDVVDINIQPILDRSEVYSGVYGRVSINFYAFNKDGNKGIAVGLNNMQKIKDGEPLGSRATAQEDFASPSADAETGAGALPFGF